MRSALVKMVRFYRHMVSPGLPACCRYLPSCSAYAEEAIGRDGVMRGTVRALGRLLRCHPFGSSGYDPP